MVGSILAAGMMPEPDRNRPERSRAQAGVETDFDDFVDSIGKCKSSTTISSRLLAHQHEQHRLQNAG